MTTMKTEAVEWFHREEVYNVMINFTHKLFININLNFCCI